MIVFTKTIIRNSDYLNIHRHLSLQMVTSDGKLQRSILYEQKTLNSRKGQRTNQKYRNLVGSDQQIKFKGLKTAWRNIGKYKTVKPNRTVSFPVFSLFKYFTSLLFVTYVKASRNMPTIYVSRDRGDYAFNLWKGRRSLSSFIGV